MGNLVGIIAPFIVDIVNKDVTDEKEKYIVTFGVCLFFGLMISLPKLMAGSTDELFTSTALILSEAVTTYKLYWQGSLLRDKLQMRLGSVQG